MTSITVRQILCPSHSHPKSSPSSFVRPTFVTFTSNNNVGFLSFAELSSKRCMVVVCKASSSPPNDNEGVSLGTMKLPSNIDIARFETLLFQWGNSLSQGANVPLPTPLKIDKIPGGARLGFMDMGDGSTQVYAYIDCVVFPGSDGSAPMFRATRNGPLKAQPPPGEERIMRSLLEALNKCVQIARI